MANMQTRTGRIGIHIQNIIFRSALICFDFECPLFGPILLPFFLDIQKIILQFIIECKFKQILLAFYLLILNVPLFSRLDNLKSTGSEIFTLTFDPLSLAAFHFGEALTTFKTSLSISSLNPSARSE